MVLYCYCVCVLFVLLFGVCFSIVFQFCLCNLVLLLGVYCMLLGVFFVVSFSLCFSCFVDNGDANVMLEL